MRHLPRHEEEILVIAIMMLVIIFVYMLISQLMGSSIISGYDATATYGADMFYQQLTAQP